MLEKCCANVRGKISNYGYYPKFGNSDHKNIKTFLILRKKELSVKEKLDIDKELEDKLLANLLNKQFDSIYK